MKAKYLLAAAIVIALGLASRTMRTGNIIIDKYSGDALYAVLFYLLIRMMLPAIGYKRTALLAFLSMTALELFQLTGIPLRMAVHPATVVHIAGKLIGTEFRFTDELAYLIGIAFIARMDARF